MTQSVRHRHLGSVWDSRRRLSLGASAMLWWCLLAPVHAQEGTRAEVVAAPPVAPQAAPARAEASGVPTRESDLRLPTPPSSLNAISRSSVFDGKFNLGLVAQAEGVSGAVFAGSMRILSAGTVVFGLSHPRARTMYSASRAPVLDGQPAWYLAYYPVLVSYNGVELAEGAMLLQDISAPCARLAVPLWARWMPVRFESLRLLAGYTFYQIPFRQMTMRDYKALDGLTLGIEWGLL